MIPYTVYKHRKICITRCQAGFSTVDTVDYPSSYRLFSLIPLSNYPEHMQNIHLPIAAFLWNIIAWKSYFIVFRDIVFIILFCLCTEMETLYPGIPLVVKDESTIICSCGEWILLNKLRSDLNFRSMAYLDYFTFSKRKMTCLLTKCKII